MPVNDVDRRTFLKAALTGAAALALSRGVWGATDTPRKPNILLIMADDLGYECLGAYGGTSYRTPNLDKLAAAGVRFDHCYSQPLCTPTRVQLMTGMYNVRNYTEFGALDPGQTTFAQLLKKAGYATCVVGKWQLAGGADAPRHFGFDEHCLWFLTRKSAHYPNPGLEINGKFVKYTNGEYGPDVLCDYACDFMQRHQDKPFCLYYPMLLPHCPFEPTPDSADWDAKSKGSPTYKGDPKYFGDMVAYMDKTVGKVFAKLDALGLRDNTLVIFTADNGTDEPVVSKMGDRKIAGAKGRTTDAGTHVPLIARYSASGARGGVCSDLVDSSDILPTICQFAGVTVPSELTIDGQSFLPQIRGEKAKPREWIYCWYVRRDLKLRECVRNHRFKLYRDGRFFEVATDPLEQSPLAESALSDEGRAARAMLQGVLDTYANVRHPSAK